MKAFELYFNPKARKNIFFETFCFDPETASEKKLGSLYLAGLISGGEPEDATLIGELATLIKSTYYQTEDDPESALRAILKQGNKLILDLAPKSPSSLSFFVLGSKEEQINFSCFGGRIGVFFCQNGKISEAEGGRIAKEAGFKNIISGRLSPGDRILIASEEMIEFFSQEKILEKIVCAENFRKVEKIISKFKKKTSSLSGFCLFLYSDDKGRDRKIFPLAGVKKPFAPKLSFSGLPHLKIPSLPDSIKKSASLLGDKPFSAGIPDFRKIANKVKSAFNKTPAWFLSNRKNIFIVSLLIVILIAGWFLSQGTKKEKIDASLKEINRAEQKMVQADSLLAQGKTKEANLLLQEALDQISAEAQKNGFAEKEAEELKTEIETKLFSANKFEKNAEFEILYEFPEGKGILIPGNMLYQNGNFYLFNQLSNKISVYNSQEKSYKSFSHSNNISFADIFGKDQIMILDSKNKLVMFRGEEFQDLGPASLPYEKTFLDSFRVFRNNLYLLGYDSAEKTPKKKIFKYGYAGNSEWEYPEIWLDNAPKESVAMGIDGLVWILEENGSIKSYYSGLFQNEIAVNIYPRPQTISKISAFSNSSYLYLLEPNQERIIIIDKNGELIKQLQNDQWSGILDFAISQDGNTAYLLKASSILKVPLGL